MAHITPANCFCLIRFIQGGWWSRCILSIEPTDVIHEGAQTPWLNIYGFSIGARNNNNAVLRIALWFCFMVKKVSEMGGKMISDWWGWVKKKPMNFVTDSKMKYNVIRAFFFLIHYFSRSVIHFYIGKQKNLSPFFLWALLKTKTKNKKQNGL